MSELNSRQWALYNYLKDMGDTWTTQYGVAMALSLVDGYYSDFDDEETFHDSPARMAMTADIRAINESDVIQKVIISSCKGVKLANEAEFDRYIRKEIMAAVRRLLRAKRKAQKGNRNGQMKFVFNSERDTVKAFIDSDKAVGERLRSARLKAGFTAAEVVAALQMKKIDEPMLSRFEHGYCLPNRTTLKELAEIYGVSVEYLTGEQVIVINDNGAENPLASENKGGVKVDTKRD